jgi:hypothetical protein
MLDQRHFKGKFQKLHYKHNPAMLEVNWQPKGFNVKRI